MKGAIKKLVVKNEEFLYFFRPLMSASLPIMKNVLTPLAKSVLIPLGLIATASATDAVIQKNIFGLGSTALTILNKEM